MKSALFGRIRRKIGFAAAVTTLEDKLSDEFWNSLSMHELMEVHIFARGGTVSRIKTGELLIAMGDERNSVDFWLEMYHLPKYRFLIKRTIAERIVGFEMTFDECHNKLKSLGCPASHFGDLLKVKMIKLAKVYDDWHVLYGMLGTFNAGTYIIRHLVETATDLNHWLFILNHSGRNKEMRQKANDEILSRARTYKQWLTIYKGCRFYNSPLRSRAVIEITRLAGKNVSKWQYVLDTLGPRNLFGKKALDFIIQAQV